MAYLHQSENSLRGFIEKKNLINWYPINQTIKGTESE